MSFKAGDRVFFKYGVNNGASVVERVFRARAFGTTAIRDFVDLKGGPYRIAPSELVHAGPYPEALFAGPYPEALFAGVRAEEVIRVFREAERLHLRCHSADHEGADAAGALAVAAFMCTKALERDEVQAPPGEIKAQIRAAWAELDGIPNNNDPCGPAEAFRKDVQVMDRRLAAATKLLGLLVASLTGEEVPR